MHDIMLRSSPQLDRASLIRYAAEAGLNVARFAEDLDEKRHDAVIERDLKLAKELDLYNTPTFYFNGRQVLGNRPYEYFKKILDEELARVQSR